MRFQGEERQRGCLLNYWSIETKKKRMTLHASICHVSEVVDWEPSRAHMISGQVSTRIYTLRAPPTKIYGAAHTGGHVRVQLESRRSQHMRANRRGEEEMCCEPAKGEEKKREFHKRDSNRSRGAGVRGGGRG